MKIQKFNDYCLLTEMKVDFLGDVYYLKEIPQCQDIPYHKSQSCSCGYSNFLNRRTYDINGFCSTANGFMAVFECLRCGEVYRHHLSPDKFDLNDFKEQLGMYFRLKSKIKKEIA